MSLFDFRHALVVAIFRHFVLIYSTLLGFQAAPATVLPSRRVSFRFVFLQESLSFGACFLSSSKQESSRSPPSILASCCRCCCSTFLLEGTRPPSRQHPALVYRALLLPAVEEANSVEYGKYSSSSTAMVSHAGPQE